MNASFTVGFTSNEKKTNKLAYNAWDLLLVIIVTGLN